MTTKRTTKRKKTPEAAPPDSRMEAVHALAALAGDIVQKMLDRDAAALGPTYRVPSSKIAARLRERAAEARRRADMAETRAGSLPGLPDEAMEYIRAREAEEFRAKAGFYDARADGLFPDATYELRLEELAEFWGVSDGVARVALATTAHPPAIFPRSVGQS